MEKDICQRADRMRFLHQMRTAEGKWGEGEGQRLLLRLGELLMLFIMIIPKSDSLWMSVLIHKNTVNSLASSPKAVWDVTLHNHPLSRSIKEQIKINKDQPQSVGYLIVLYLSNISDYILLCPSDKGFVCRLLTFGSYVFLNRIDLIFYVFILKLFKG